MRNRALWPAEWKLLGWPARLEMTERLASMRRAGGDLPVLSSVDSTRSTERLILRSGDTRNNSFNATAGEQGQPERLRSRCCAAAGRAYAFDEPASFGSRGSRAILGETYMNKKFTVAWIVVLVAWFLGSFLVHGVLLNSDYMQLPNLFRTEADAQKYFPLMILAHVMLSGAFVWIYARGTEPKPWMAQGVRFGIAVALLTTVP